MIQKQVVNNEIISKEALQMANYNQQYSRKFNIKIMNYPEKKDEKIRDIFVKDIVKDKLNVKVDPPEIQAIYRIRGKIGEARPVIVKLVNSEVKYRIMRAKENLSKKENVRLVEDVTKHNMGLITKLRNCKEFESACVW
jgi:MinD-like ATPase involved in chromosome partitioning or flagellar assembly